MERLTQRNFDYCLECCPGETMIGCAFYRGDTESKCAVAACYDRLASYEDTGLEPEEIKGPYDSLKAHLYDVETELKVYQQAEAEGHLLVLPCKVGDDLYVVTRNVVSQFFVDHFELHNGVLWVSWQLVSGTCSGFRLDGFPASDIGKTVFLTREEAEAALKQEVESDG